MPAETLKMDLSKTRGRSNARKEKERGSEEVRGNVGVKVTRQIAVDNSDSKKQKKIDF